MKETPIDYNIVQKNMKDIGLKNFGSASIREIRRLAIKIEKESGKKFIHMEMGIPGLKPSQIAIDAEKEAMSKGIAGLYPDIGGISELKIEISKFVKLFIDIDVSPRSCVPSVGSINGSYASFMVAGRMEEKRDTVLFIDPGFPVHKQLIKMLGIKQDSFDIYNFRGDKLKNKLESYFKNRNISTVLYSNPNNPSWICFTEKELKIIGELATQYNVIVIEDLAYFAMDFRKDLSKPGKPPFQATVARYTNNYIILISSSKTFSYPGQRVGIMAISDKLYDSNYNGLLKYYPTDNFGHSIVVGTIYTTTAGATHSAQYGLTAILKAANDGHFDFVNNVKEYCERAKILKPMFTKNGFNIVYDMDGDEPVGDGFFFTVSYPGFSGEELVEELLYYGISTIPLSTTGSERTEGIRVCVSLVNHNDFDILEERLKKFNME